MYKTVGWGEGVQNNRVRGGVQNSRVHGGIEGSNTKTYSLGSRIEGV